MASSAGFAPLDAVLWAEGESRPFQLSDVVARAVKLNGGYAVAVAFETVFTEGTHPFDDLPVKASSIERRQHPTLELIRIEDYDGPWILAAMATEHAGVFHIFSGLPRTHPRWQRVERWIKNAREVSRCFLNHADFTAIGDRLSEFGNVEVVRVAARVVADGSSINRGFPPRAGSMRPSHLEEIAEIEHFGAAVKTITLNVADTMLIHVRRVAGATYYSGNFKLFADQILSRLAEATAQRRGLLSGRQRTSASMPTAITVSLPDPLLRTPEETGELLRLVDAMTDVTVAVFHRNPYLHFAVTDEHDGSNFDVLVTRDDAIDIYPGYRASPAALARISQRLGEQLGATTIADGPQRELVSIYDLMDA